MNWSTLNTKVTSANTKADAINTRVDQVVVCSRKGLLYAPGQSGADGQGCVKPYIDDSAINQLNTRMNSVLACASQGRMFNGSSCVTAVVVTTATPRLQCRVTSNVGPGPHYASRAQCNSDEIMTGGGGQSETEGTNLCSGLGSSFIHATVPSGNGWAVDGYRPGGGDACTIAYAICCKIVN
ncbi:hypothetical protein O9X90_25705 [Agrobacterium leguminum]|uniref:hypothetical protein n=1 Tax=Agrobacterium leguminum TaxID=2792015 RepID=UPI0022B84505|nr:hypothetical protein [Agrobacterium leguminum]MCZ7935727.1 hypothetical protein [Agrobacterium leguminum]